MPREVPSSCQTALSLIRPDVTRLFRGDDRVLDQLPHVAGFEQGRVAVGLARDGRGLERRPTVIVCPDNALGFGLDDLARLFQGVVHAPFVSVRHARKQRRSLESNSSVHSGKLIVSQLNVLPLTISPKATFQPISSASSKHRATSKGTPLRTKAAALRTAGSAAIFLLAPRRIRPPLPPPSSGKVGHKRPSRRQDLLRPAGRLLRRVRRVSWRRGLAARQ